MQQQLTEQPQQLQRLGQLIQQLVLPQPPLVPHLQRQLPRQQQQPVPQLQQRQLLLQQQLLLHH